MKIALGCVTLLEKSFHSERLFFIVILFPRRYNKRVERIGVNAMTSDEHKEPLHQRHDTSFRFLLSSKKLFVELLRSFVHRGWVESIDETSVREIPHSFVLQDFKRKEADLVYQVKIYSQRERRGIRDGAGESLERYRA